ncbi:MAG: CotH kinase family protein [Pseudomonadota bacterium]|nr:CotH kinase family protein [Pseudomonadota bacterium]
MFCAPVLCAIGCGPGITADEPLWDPGAVPAYRIQIADGWEDRLAEAFDPFGCEDRTYERATVLFENPETGKTETWEDVGVRYRGHNAYEESAMERRGFKLSFDTFLPDRTFHGVDKINLLGTEGDFTLLRERIALGVMNDAGVVAPRVSHARLYVNGTYMGVFPNSEEADDKAFVASRFEEEGGSYYKVKGYCGDRATLQYISDDPTAYTGTYEPKAGTNDADVSADLIPMLACASSGSDEELAACLPDHLDVDSWLREIAVDMALPDVDGMAGAGQNFLLFRPPEGRFVVVPWDKDLSLTLTNHNEADGSIFDLHPKWLGDSRPVLVNRLREVYREDFCQAVLDVARLTDPALLSPQIDDLEALLLPYMKNDPFIDWITWQYVIDDLHETVGLRHEQVVMEASACAG